MSSLTLGYIALALQQVHGVKLISISKCSNKLRTTGKESNCPELHPANTDDAVAVLDATCGVSSPRPQQWHLTHVQVASFVRRPSARARR